MNATDLFERAAIFRVKLAQRLGLPAGKDPDGVGIALGPDDSLVVSMPLPMAEALLDSGPTIDVTPSPALSPGARYERALGVAAALLSRMGRETTLVLDERLPIVGVVCTIVSPVLAADERGYVTVDADGVRMQIPLEEVAEVRA